jgi:hypothetical protein
VRQYFLQLVLGVGKIPFFVKIGEFFPSFTDDVFIEHGHDRSQFGIGGRQGNRRMHHREEDERTNKIPLIKGGVSDGFVDKPVDFAALEHLHCRGIIGNFHIIEGDTIKLADCFCERGIFQKGNGASFDIGFGLDFVRICKDEHPKQPPRDGNRHRILFHTFRCRGQFTRESDLLGIEVFNKFVPFVQLNFKGNTEKFGKEVAKSDNESFLRAIGQLKHFCGNQGTEREFVPAGFQCLNGGNFFVSNAGNIPVRFDRISRNLAFRRWTAPQPRGNE